MLQPNNAWNLILSHTVHLPTTRQDLRESLGFVLAEDVRADRDIPPSHHSSMDGYAVRSSDVTNGPCSLRLIGEIAAGSSSRPRIGAGACARILTGANVPPGADSVVPVEETEESNGYVKVLSAVKRGANVLTQGQDARKGVTLLHKGTVMGASEIGVCATVGKATIQVHDRPRIALLCTGAELRGIEAPVRRHELRDSNGPTLAATLSHWGFRDITRQIVPDRVNRLVSVIRQKGRQCDVILLTGGMSVGKYDVVREAIEKAGATVYVHGVAMKPGKPFLFATLPGDRFIFGLPGNPLSALTAFHEFVLPALRRLSGMAPKASRPSLRLPLAAPLTSKGELVRFILGRLRWEESGPSVTAVASQSSADLVSALKADGAIVFPADVREMKSGDLVEFRPWRTLP